MRRKLIFITSQSKKDSFKSNLRSIQMEVRGTSTPLSGSHYVNKIAKNVYSMIKSI